MTINITNVNPMGDYIRVTATGEFNLKVPRGPNSTFDFAETKLTLSDDDTKAIEEAHVYFSATLVDDQFYRDGIEVDGVLIFGDRRYEMGGKVYRVRDVRDTPDSRIRCEYATKDEAGNTVWKPCREGVNFADIEPFEPIAA